jgi:type VI secretion system protein ImpF
MSKDRLRPSLLDRLTDRQPERQVERGQEQAVNEAQLRSLLRRDLTWLFNATRPASFGPDIDLAQHPEVQRSVLNFGIPALTGRTLSSVQVEELEQSVTQALCWFEPRLIAESLQVRVLKGSREFGAAALVFDIEAEMWAEPLPLRLHLRSEVDLESGRVAIHDTVREER